MDQLKHLIEVWTSYAQALTGSIGALAFVCAFIWMIARLDKVFIFVNRYYLNTFWAPYRSGRVFQAPFRPIHRCCWTACPCYLR